MKTEKVEKLREEIKQIERKVERVINNKTVEHHIELIKWLYDNYREVLREYESTIGKFRICFVSKEESEGK